MIFLLIQKKMKLGRINQFKSVIEVLLTMQTEILRQIAVLMAIADFIGIRLEGFNEWICLMDRMKLTHMILDSSVSVRFQFCALSAISYHPDGSVNQDVIYLSNTAELRLNSAEADLFGLSGSDRIAELHTDLAEVGDLIGEFSPEESGINLLFPETEIPTEIPNVSPFTVPTISLTNWIHFWIWIVVFALLLFWLWHQPKSAKSLLFLLTWLLVTCGSPDHSDPDDGGIDTSDANLGEKRPTASLRLPAVGKKPPTASYLKTVSRYFLFLCRFSI